MDSGFVNEKLFKDFFVVSQLNFAKKITDAKSIKQFEYQGCPFEEEAFLSLYWHHNLVKTIQNKNKNSIIPITC